MAAFDISVQDTSPTRADAQATVGGGVYFGDYAGGSGAMPTWVWAGIAVFGVFLLMQQRKKKG